MTKTLIVSLVTALLMIAIGIFWMFIWLVGTNGYGESKGTLILGGNLALVVLSVVVSGASSGWLANKLEARLGWPFWVAAPLAIFVAVAVSVVALFAGSVLIVLVFGQTR